MNEAKLKDLFVSSLESGRILNNNGDSMSFVNPGDEIRLKNEAYFGLPWLRLVRIFNTILDLLKDLLVLLIL
ncbi:MAG: hypothetical protein QN424_00225 [Nitrososphaeraceae archaeon]|nr:hypothetical protein [Nitrososphaeraceae archaeon]MDW0237587.1 hypothetical protein [Nitrososphaeraceae archaeon]MDW0246163.1 hypothetical protein [Nitrososphaeraceae archaeon]MDW0340748.1 hypothetical protein [Nitrososphaeraceae archaeon]